MKQTQTTYKVAVNCLSHSYDGKLVSDNIWYVRSKLISERESNGTGIPGKSIQEIEKANGKCCNTV